MADSIYKDRYSVDTDKSELSILRLDADIVQEFSESLERMLKTAKRISGSDKIIQPLYDLVKEQPTDRTLGKEEVSRLDELLVKEGLEKLGVIANDYGIWFGMSRERGDGTIPNAPLEHIIFAFQDVFSEIKEKTLGNVTFNGVVFLKHSKTGEEIGLKIMNSEIKVQKPTIVWQDIEGAVFEPRINTPQNTQKQKTATVPSGPFTKCWG